MIEEYCYSGRLYSIFYGILWAPLMEGLAGTGLALEQSERIPYEVHIHLTAPKLVMASR